MTASPPGDGEQRCGATVGDKPWWMGEGQFDATRCTCYLPTGHAPVTGRATDNGHACSHSVIDAQGVTQ